MRTISAYFCWKMHLTWSCEYSWYTSGKHAYIILTCLTLVMLNKLRCHAHFYFLANQIIWSGFLIEIHIFNNKQCRSRSTGSTLFAKTGHVVFSKRRVKSQTGQTGDQEVVGSTPARFATFFRGDWSWNIFCYHYLPSTDSRREVVSFWWKNVHNTG